MVVSGMVHSFSIFLSAENLQPASRGVVLGWWASLVGCRCCLGAVGVVWGWLALFGGRGPVV